MSNDKITPTQAIAPVILLSCIVFLFLAFQTFILKQDRSNFSAAIIQQQQELDQIDKVKAQLSALAMGTLKLSQEGDKDAANIIAQLKKAGVNVGDPSQSSTSSGPTMDMMPATPMTSPAASTSSPQHPATPATKEK